MRVAIIGAGNVGKALGSSLGRAGHSVVYAAASAESARQAAKSVSGNAATAAASVREAAQAAEIVVLAIPYSAAREVVAELAPVIAGKVVIDATNPVKALNTLFASLQADPKSHGVEIDAFFATDDEAAREQVGTLLRSLGFRPVYVGPLVRARELEALGYLNIALQMGMNGDWRTTFSMIGAPKAAL